MKILIYLLLLLIYSSNLLSQTILRENVTTNSVRTERIIKGENDNFYILTADSGIKGIIDFDYKTFDTNWSHTFGFKASPTGDYDAGDISLRLGDMIINSDGVRYSGGRIHHMLTNGYYYYTHLINTNGKLVSDTLVYEKDNWDLYINAQVLDFIQKDDFSLAYGYEASGNSERQASFVLKYDNKGKLLKRSSLDSVGPLEYQSIWKMKEVTDGEYILIGHHNDTTKKYPGFFTARMNSELEFYQKERIFDDKSVYWMSDFDVNGDNTAVLFENKNYENKIEDTPEVNMLLAFLDKEGKLETFKTYVENFYTIAKGIKAYKDGYLIYGSTSIAQETWPYFPNEEARQNIIIYVDKSGNEIWRKVWGEDGVTDFINLCEIINDKKVLLVGSRDGNLIYTELETIISSVSEEENQKAQTHIKIYPNPSNNNINISYPAMKNIIIYNMLGEKVRAYNLLTDELNISTQDLLSGTYFIEIKTRDGEVFRQKFVRE